MKCINLIGVFIFSSSVFAINFECSTARVHLLENTNKHNSKSYANKADSNHKPIVTRTDLIEDKVIVTNEEQSISQTIVLNTNIDAELNAKLTLKKSSIVDDCSRIEANLQIESLTSPNQQFNTKFNTNYVGNGCIPSVDIKNVYGNFGGDLGRSVSPSIFWGYRFRNISDLKTQTNLNLGMDKKHQFNVAIGGMDLHCRGIN